MALNYLDMKPQFLELGAVHASSLVSQRLQVECHLKTTIKNSTCHNITSVALGTKLDNRIKDSFETKSSPAQDTLHSSF